MTILADAAERAEDIDEARAEEARKKAQELLSQNVGNDEASIALERATLRLRVAEIRRRRHGGHSARAVTSPPGLDLDALARYLAPHVGGLAGSLRGEVIPGGRSNLTYIVDDGERRFVVRRPPLAHVLPTAHDMAREYRVLAALQGTGIPVPQVIALCEDESVIGARFYVMEWIDGHVVRDALPAEFPDTTETRRAMSSALIDTLLQLHAHRPRRDRPRRLRAPGRIPRPPGAALVAAVGGVEDPRAAEHRGVAPPASTRRCPRRPPPGSCTATTVSTTSCTRPRIRRASSP